MTALGTTLDGFLVSSDRENTLSIPKKMSAMNIKVINIFVKLVFELSDKKNGLKFDDEKLPEKKINPITSKINNSCSTPKIIINFELNSIPLNATKLKIISKRMPKPILKRFASMGIPNIKMVGC